MPPSSVYKHGRYGLATRPGSANDLTEYRSTKRAKAFYDALLDPDAQTIRRKSGESYPKRQHGLIYRYSFKDVYLSDVTKEMSVVTRVGKNPEPDIMVRVTYPVLDAKRTFQLQTTYPGELITGDAPSVNTYQKRKLFNHADVEGKRKSNRHRDW
jgi:hypothetical protein